MIDKKEHLGIPVKSEYKYLGVWFNEVIDPLAQISKSTRKVDYITWRLLIIPKTAITPKLLINLWTLIIRPVFDYALCLAELDGTQKILTYVTSLRKAFKKCMRLRNTTANYVVDSMMGYDPLSYARWLALSATEKWNNRRSRSHTELTFSQYRTIGSNILLSWPLLKTSNMLFHRCRQHDTLLTPTHLIKFHSITVPKIEEVVALGAVVEKKLREAKKRGRKGRVYGFIERIFLNHSNIYQNVCSIVA